MKKMILRHFFKGVFHEIQNFKCSFKGTNTYAELSKDIYVFSIQNISRINSGYRELCIILALNDIFWRFLPKSFSVNTWYFYEKKISTF